MADKTQRGVIYEFMLADAHGNPDVRYPEVDAKHNTDAIIDALHAAGYQIVERGRVTADQVDRAIRQTFWIGGFSCYEDFAPRFERNLKNISAAEVV